MYGNHHTINCARERVRPPLAGNADLSATKIIYIFYKWWVVSDKLQLIYSSDVMVVDCHDSNLMIHCLLWVD